MDKTEFYRIEEALLDLLKVMEPMIADSDMAQLREFIDVGEYGVGLEWLIGVVVEDNKRIAAESYDRIIALAEQMGIRSEVATPALAACVIREEPERRGHQ